MPTIGFVHTVLSLPATFAGLAEELSPEAEVFHIVDESLLTVTRKGGSLTSLTRRRVLEHILSAADAGADVVVVTCSSIGPAVAASRAFAPVPVVRIDEAMADEAVRRGPRIGVLATLRTTLEPTAELVEQRAAAAGTPVTVVPRLCDGAFEALAAGDRDAHDELVREGMRRLVEDADVVVLAQASMARIADELPAAGQTVPVLSSPRLGMERVAELVAQPSAARVD
jgi:Asp/Glu/hydantoin racemase